MTPGNSVRLASSQFVTCEMKGQEMEWLLKALKIETVFPEEGKKRGEGRKEMNEEAQHGRGGDTETGHHTAFPG